MKTPPVGDQLKEEKSKEGYATILLKKKSIDNVN